MEENKLIAEFMDMQLTDIGWYDNKGVLGLNDNTFDELKFHQSWDWLMPVIEDIDHIQFEPVESIEKALFTRSIRDTHKAVVEYIKEYILIQQESNY